MHPGALHEKGEVWEENATVGAGMTVAMPCKTTSPAWLVHTVSSLTMFFSARISLTVQVGGDGVPEADGPGELQLLAQVDGAGAGQLHGQDGGNEAGAEDAVGNPSAEPGGAGHGLVDMGGVQIGR